MPSRIIEANKVMLLFKSMEEMSQFKHECICCDFYIDRDEMALVGSFTPNQVQIALTKYRAVAKKMV